MRAGSCHRLVPTTIQTHPCHMCLPQTTGGSLFALAQVTVTDKTGHGEGTTKKKNCSSQEGC